MSGFERIAKIGIGREEKEKFRQEVEGQLEQRHARSEDNE